MTTAQNDQQGILLRQKVFELTHELQLTRIQNQNLMSEVAELKEKQQQQKQINDMLMDNLKNSQQQINDQITLNINGEFLTQRIHELQSQLEKYKSGVSESVDRRVRKIVGQYTQEKDLQYEKRKSRLSMGPRASDHSSKYFETHEHKYYNIEYKTCSDVGLRGNSRDNMSITLERKGKYGDTMRNILKEHQDSICKEYPIVTDPTNTQRGIQGEVFCSNCYALEQLINQKQNIIHKLNEQLRLLQGKQGGIEEKTTKANSNTDEWKLKYLQTLKLYENLRQTHENLLAEFNSLTSTQSGGSPSHQTRNNQSYIITQSPINGFKKRQVYPSSTLHNANPCESRFYTESKDRQQQMLQEITNLVNGLGRGTKPQSKENSQKNHIYIQENKSRVSYTNAASRVSQAPKIDGSQFTIKLGVNRYGQGNGLF